MMYCAKEKKIEKSLLTEMERKVCVKKRTKEENNADRR